MMDYSNTNGVGMARITENGSISTNQGSSRTGLGDDENSYAEYSNSGSVSYVPTTTGHLLHNGTAYVSNHQQHHIPLTNSKNLTVG